MLENQHFATHRLNRGRGTPSEASTDTEARLGGAPSDPATYPLGL